MFQQLYIEEDLIDHPKVHQLKKRFADIPHITCRRYQEIFNRTAQNFRLQKQSPSLILAKKFSQFVLPTPEGYHLGGDHHFYFSHMLNFIFDCRYCFLQGMYRSAHFVLFVNFEDFKEAILKTLSQYPGKSLYFFSGYDCDSLALEPLTEFAGEFIPFFAELPKAYLEFRTKSIQIAPFMKSSPLANVFIAFTLSPEKVVQKLEHKTPSLKRRLEAIQKLQKKGWKIGLRFDPLIYDDHYQEMYTHFFEQVFAHINSEHIHSITLGVFRLPKPFFKTMSELYPEEKLFARSLNERLPIVSYDKARGDALKQFCLEQLMRYVPPELIFSNEV